ncbi:hypothetical protein Tco_0492235 [Tanacetum coccineum]
MMLIVVTNQTVPVDDDLQDLRYVEAEFPAIVIDDAFAPQDALPLKIGLQEWIRSIRIKPIRAVGEDLQSRDTQGSGCGFSRDARAYERGPLVWELILEFLSTLRFGEVLLDLDALDTIQFQLGGARRWLDVGSVNIPYLLARHLRRFTTGRKSESHISGGQFMGRLAQLFGLLTTEIFQGLTVISPELPIIDMAELVRLQIYEQLDDTWAWVSMGPKRQPNAAAGAPGVAQDALIVDEGGQADPAPAQAPPPPLDAAKTMPWRMARLKEDVHEICGMLSEQREVISAMARDFSRFCTWTTTGLARMMDRAGVTYTSYSETPRKYTRRVRRRIDGANTSTAQQGL